jgi:hypothetical protein
VGKTVMICTPMYGGMCNGAFASSLLNLTQTLEKNGHNFLFTYLTNESLIQRGRNTLAHIFLAREDATHLMFIDADIGFNADDVIKMLDADKGIIGGLYPKKTLNWANIEASMKLGLPVPTNFSGDFVYDPEPGIDLIYFDQPFELRHVGTGFMLIKREVFTEMIPHVDSYSGNGYTVDHGEKVHNFFQVAVVDNVLLSEDYFFCNTYKKLGGKIYGAPWCNFRHLGTYAFEGSFVETLKLKDGTFFKKKGYDVFDAIYKNNGWGSNESKSGRGSEINNSSALIKAFPKIINSCQITSILDIPCGDWNWMRCVDLEGVKYIGADIVADLVKDNKTKYPETDFRVLNILEDPLPKADLVICRDLFVHMPLEDIRKALDNIISSGAKYLLLSTYTTQVENKEVSEVAGYRKLNMYNAPFNFPPALELISENNKEPGTSDKSIGLWRISSL